MEHFALEMLHDNADIAARAVYCRGTGGNMHPRPVRLRLCAATFFRFQAGLVSQNAALAPGGQGHSQYHAITASTFSAAD